ncbi:MAG TPA: response regulator transcription factor [Arthrobacter sp.]|nr:response regulator transcription factor [Arthrobacter sp.]
MAVVVEDDEDIRGLLEAVLLQSGFEVHPTGSGVSGVELVDQQDPDLVTLDLGLPDIDGFEVARRIRSTSDAHIVMLTARTDEIDTVLGLETGADDFLTKPFSPRELRARIEAIMRRRGRERPVVQPPPRRKALEEDELSTREQDLRSRSLDVAASTGTSATMRLNGLVLDAPTHCVMVDEVDIALTPTEFSLLRSVMAGGRTIRTKTSLARRLRGEEPDSGTFVSEADERSVEVHIGNLRRKLGDDAKSPRWIETVRGIGYRAAPAPPPTAASAAPGFSPDAHAASSASPGGAAPSRDVSMQLMPDRLEVSFVSGTRLGEEHLQAINDRLADSGVTALVMLCTGLSSVGTTAAAWNFGGRHIRAAFVGAGPTDRLLVHFFNRSDAAPYTWEYFEDLDTARFWAQQSS